MPRTRVITREEHYIHVLFQSRIFRFTDDVEFEFDDEHEVIHLRSASRVGYYDLGVNRKRMNHITEAYLPLTEC